MAPDDWLRAVAVNLRASPTSAARFMTLAYKLRTDFPPSALTQTTAQDVCEGLESLPTYPELRDRLQALGPFTAPIRPDQEANQTNSWRTYIARRLAEGGDPDHLLSLAKTYVPERDKDAFMRDLFPRAWEREKAHRAEILRDKAKIVAALAQRWAPPEPAALAKAQPPAEPARPRESHLPTSHFKAWRERAGQ